MTLANSGFSVEVVCPSGHPVEKTSVVRRTYSYGGLSPLKSFADAISATQPDLVIPGDDLAAEQLHALYSQQHAKEDVAAKAICSVLERSLGAPESFRSVFERSTFIELARLEGVRVPKTQVANNLADLNACADQMGFPLVLKANGTSGGNGVRVVKSLDEARRALRTLQAPPLMARAMKRALVDNDRTLIWPSLSRRRSVVNAQAFIPGREATSLVACWEGKVLAGLHFEVLSKGASAGPASVLRWVDDVDMLNAAEKMACRLNLSGLHGFDFMREASTGNAFLIEELIPAPRKLDI